VHEAIHRPGPCAWPARPGQKGGFYHDGRFATLPDVIQHYNSTFGLQLTDAEVSDLTQFLLSLPND
jgi:hypothetical protein